jgi:hypothetical protein
MSKSVIKMTEEQYHELDEGMQGVCLACNSVRDCCEPDARRYKCESCGEKMVYGAAELLVMGAVEFCAEEEVNIEW